MDRLLTGINREWFHPFILILILLAVIQITVAWVQAVYSLKLSDKLAAVSSSSYMWKILRLPMEFFSQRLAGDIQSRLALNASIAGTLVNTFGPLLLHSAMMVFYFVLMFRGSVLLTSVGLGALFINILTSCIISEKRINITLGLFHEEKNDNGYN